MSGQHAGIEATALSRAPLRERVRRVVQRAIVRGTLAPGGDVNEAELAARLGVSRTPLREALLGLEAEGYLESAAGRGFHVMPLTERDVEEIYPLLWTLEGLALRNSPLPSPVIFKRLTALNHELTGATPERALAIDQEWHTMLLARCRNRRLLESIALHKDLAERYELAYMRHSGNVPISAKQHRAIMAALRKSDVAKAISHLEENWRVSQEFLIPWIRSTTQSPPARKRGHRS